MGLFQAGPVLAGPVQAGLFQAGLFQAGRALRFPWHSSEAQPASLVVLL